ncbi:lipase family protein [Bacillus haynesii]|uniref:lipase n=1 Tax=Bacillus haynesii TaxID=1925021 RepID=UPI00227E67AF|nr:lipase [Bacillus haynesii]MCY7770672.1 lipase family protein [Bacillus haynesii]MCY8012193.1 lipase family protein [Bacillus haynesii]MCY8101383.1 lipase family protein [Bacillus haynesii]MCY8347792.1 lipase family protein [Bacillus haynesii]MCY8350585.1 lipase family protein [Bacillus haynesii]
MPKNINIPNVSDKEYYYLSRFSYNYDKIKKSLKENRPLTTSSSSRWYVEKIKSDDDTGLDAVVLSQAEKRNGKWVKSDNPKNVVVAFAGTDPGKDPLSDVEQADVNNIVLGNDPKDKTQYVVKKDARDTSTTFGRYTGSMEQTAMLESGDYKLITKTSQIDQADQLVREVKQKYKGTSTIISTTGHSLGGAEAEYSAVNNDIYAVSFNSPSIVKLHSEKKQKEINNGDYNPYVKSIVNPDDMVGAGWWDEFDRHNGTTIYTKDPSIAMANREKRLDGNKLQQVGRNLLYFANTLIFQNPDTHWVGSNNFSFDENGNVQNIEGDELVYDKNLKAMLPPEVASGSGAIKVTPEVAKQLAQKVNAIIDDLRTMKREAENAYQEHDAEINDLKHDTYRQVGHGLYDKLTLEDVNNTLKNLAQSFDKKGNPLFYDVHAEKAYIASLQNTISDLEDISGYLAQIAKDFKSKDKMLANWLKL